jgi:hypothetical protein
MIPAVPEYNHHTFFVILQDACEIFGGKLVEMEVETISWSSPCVGILH